MALIFKANIYLPWQYKNPCIMSNGYEEVHVQKRLRNRNQTYEGMGVSDPLPTLKICNFAAQKRQCNVLFQGNLLDPGPFDQPLLLKSPKKIC